LAKMNVISSAFAAVRPGWAPNTADVCFGPAQAREIDRCVDPQFDATAYPDAYCMT
jgi:hypothetical protein